MAKIAARTTQIGPGLIVKINAQSLRDFTKLLPRNDGFLWLAAFIHYDFPFNLDHEFSLSLP